MKGVAKAAVSAVLVFSAASVLAWTGPTASPPNNNVAAPVNTSGTAQTKTGYLGVNGGYSGGLSWPFSVGGAASNWTGIFNWPYNTTPSGSLGILVGGQYSLFENPSGYYTYLTNGSYGVDTNGYIHAVNSFGGGFAQYTTGPCAQGNGFTGGCSCPGFAGSAMFLYYTYVNGYPVALYLCY